MSSGRLSASEMIRPWPDKRIHANAAGLQWLAALKPDPLSTKRCERYPWVCPYLAQGVPMPCHRRQQNRRASELVVLAFVNWVVTREPVGQMSLFEPGITHKQVFRHWKTGRKMEPYPKPAFYEIVCKKMALAAIRWTEKTGWLNPPDWRILPLKKEDLGWNQQMIERHNLKPCWFDTV